MENAVKLDPISREFARPKAACVLVAAVAFALAPALGLAADLDRGEQLARQWCASCHVLPGSTQPVPQGPPSFRDIAHSGKTAEQLRVFLTRPHGAMPPLTLSRVEIDALVGYIESLR